MLNISLLSSYMISIYREKGGSIDIWVLKFNLNKTLLDRSGDSDL